MLRSFELPGASIGMGVDLYALERDFERPLRVGTSVHQVGVARRLWKLTSTGMRENRGTTLEDLADEQATRAVRTPHLVLIESATEFDIDGRTVEAFRVLGWDAGRLLVQDLDWDHLPTIGWAVVGENGEAVLHEERQGQLVALDDQRARDLGILWRSGDLAEHRLPTIIECRSVRRLSGPFYEADCRLADGRGVVVAGESETGELPAKEWFAGQSTATAGRYRLVDQLGFRRSPP